MDQVQQMLGQEFAMFYCGKLPFTKLVPQQTLDDSIRVVNHYLKTHGNNLSEWESGMQDEIARLLNVNWIWQRLKQEPIRKPFLVHEHQQDFKIDCGDTRHMALNLLPDPPTVTAVITVPKSQSAHYSAWQPIHSDQDLIAMIGLDAGSAQIYYTKTHGMDWAVSWLEIGDNSTSHHLHNITVKLNMMQQYLNDQQNFEFSRAWFTQYHDWS